MAAQQLTWLAWTCFAIPEFLVVQNWIHATFSSSDTINLTEPPVYHYTKFLEGVVGYTPLGSLVPNFWL